MYAFLISSSRQYHADLELISATSSKVQTLPFLSFTMLIEFVKVSTPAFFQLPGIIVLIILRAGKTFTTRGIKALQRGKPVFILLSSFSKVELGHPSAQWPMPTDVKPPEQCQDQADKILEWANQAENPDRKAHLLQLRQVRAFSDL